MLMFLFASIVRDNALVSNHEDDFDHIPFDKLLFLLPLTGAKAGDEKR
jgi:hypothetical protein